MAANQQQSSSPQIKMRPNHGLLECVKKLYLNTKAADVNFSFQSNNGAVTRIAANKDLLAASSDVFDPMFYGQLKEMGEITVTDVSDAAFMEFLQFFYLDEVKLTEENIAGVLYLGHKYQVKRCVNSCTKFLKDTVTVANIFIGLNLAHLYDLGELMEHFQVFIRVNTYAVFKSTGFLECEKQSLARILEIDSLSCPEVEVFEACMAWVKAKSGQATLSNESVDAHLGELFYKIRFASMTMEQLCTLPTEYDSALRNDFKTIASIISVPGFWPKKFNTKVRHRNQIASVEKRAIHAKLLKMMGSPPHSR